MKEWLKAFWEAINSKSDSVTITMSNEETGQQSYKPSDFERIAEGHDKAVYRIKNTNQCIFVPSQNPGLESWKNHIEVEADTLDEMRGLGLKTQEFNIVEATIQLGEEAHTIPVLIADELNHVCTAQSIVIYDSKGKDGFTVFGTYQNFNFPPIKTLVDHAKIVQSMLRQIVKDYAIAYTFSYPLNMTTRMGVDDSSHVCFERQKRAEAYPIARYIFWDVASDMGKVRQDLFPSLPTLKDLKRGHVPDNLKRSPEYALETIAEEVLIALERVQSLSSTKEKFRKASNCLSNAMNDDEFLYGILEEVREVLRDRFENEFEADKIQCLALIKDLALIKAKNS